MRYEDFEGTCPACGSDMTPNEEKDRWECGCGMMFPHFPVHSDKGGI